MKSDDIKFEGLNRFHNYICEKYLSNRTSFFLIAIRFLINEKLSASDQDDFKNNFTKRKLKEYLAKALREYNEGINVAYDIQQFVKDVDFNNKTITRMFWALDVNDNNLVLEFLDQILIKEETRPFEFMTNKSIAKLGVRIANPKDSYICYEPFLGAGVFFTSIDTNPTLFGTDKNEFNLLIAIIRSIVARKQFTYKFSNTYQNISEKKEFADVVFADGPMAGIIENSKNLYKDYPQLFPSKYANIANILITLNSMKEDGIGIIHLPTGVLFSTSAIYLRLKEYLVNNNLIDAIIDLNQMCYCTGVSTILLILRKNKKDDQKIVFINSKNYTAIKEKYNYITEEGIEVITNIVKEKKEIKGISAVKSISEVFNSINSLMVSRFVEISDKRVFRPLYEIDSDMNKVWKSIVKNVYDK